ncbi:MAG: ABC transporter permease, partial [Gammaproteobacteria bacterium]|nr:ABC transporter permease [Gammaproteobacteria bacterium]
RIAFFVTPIIWMPELLPNRAVLPMNLNPFFHVLEVVRAPLLGELPSAVSWLAMIGYTLVGGAATFVIYVRYRWRIAYWV